MDRTKRSRISNLNLTNPIMHLRHAMNESVVYRKTESLFFMHGTQVFSVIEFDKYKADSSCSCCKALFERRRQDNYAIIYVSGPF